MGHKPVTQALSNRKFIIQSPPSFMPKKPDQLKYEGYWNDNYMPIVSDQIWPDKEKFFKTVLDIEVFLAKNGKDIQYRGLSPSRLYSDVYVGSVEYNDDEYMMGWPENYVKHYILENNVMPTERFFNYICERIKSIPKK